MDATLEVIDRDQSIVTSVESFNFHFGLCVLLLQVHFFSQALQIPEQSASAAVTITSLV